MPTLSGLSLRAAGLAVAVALALPAWAMPGGTVVAPTYEALVARLADLPAAVEADARVQAADALVDQARALPNPTLAMERENVYGSGSYTGSDSAETTVSINQPLELWGQRRARVAVARARASTAGLARDLQQWVDHGRLARAYAQAEAAQRRHALAAEALALAEQDAAAMAALVRAGREPELRRLQARSEVEAAIAARDEAAAAEQGALARLAATALLDGPIVALGSSLLDRPVAPWTTTDPDPPAVRIAQAELEVARRQIVVEQRRALPAIDASLGHRRFAASADSATTLGLSISVPLFDRNGGGIRAAQAQARAAEASLQARQREADAERAVARAQLASSGSRVRAADSSVATAAEAYRLARIGLEAGRIAPLELRGSREALIAARNTVVEARLSRALAEIDLALLEGRAPFGEAR